MLLINFIKQQHKTHYKQINTKLFAITYKKNLSIVVVSIPHKPLVNYLFDVGARQKTWAERRHSK